MGRGANLLVAMLVVVVATVVTAQLALGERAAASRCPRGTEDHGVRCCPLGQYQDGAACVGTPTACPAGLEPAEAAPGCVATPATVALRGGTVTLGPSDWESQGVVASATFEVAPFRLDRHEVTQARWTDCVKMGVCRGLDATEPGLPVTGVTPDAADRFCRSAGGRLPTGRQWLYAATGSDGRRFPWGPTGLVCRRASFGRRTGPCAWGGGGPELAGLHAAGATLAGVQDLAGNVAEWTRQPDGNVLARGGSYASKVAAQLKSWSAERTTAGPTIGFRCAYPALGSRQ